jgi:hypothetical protein
VATKHREEKPIMRSTVLRSVVVLAAVSLAAGSAFAADRMVIIEHHTATW